MNELTGGSNSKISEIILKFPKYSKLNKIKFLWSLKDSRIKYWFYNLMKSENHLKLNNNKILIPKFYKLLKIINKIIKQQK